MNRNTLFGQQVLVTGGAGFIGSHLVEALVAQGAKVTVLDNLTTGNLNNLTAVQNDIIFLEGDITNPKDCATATKNQAIVFHCAAFTSAPASVDLPDDCFRINVLGTHTVMESARKNNVGRVIFCSSAAVYGQTAGIVAESNPCHPASPYGFSKLIGEQILQTYYTSYRMPTVALRYFNVFGPRQDPHSPYAGVVAHFTQKLRTNSPITIFGDGTQTRDFVPVAEIVAANLLFAQLDASHLTAQACNIATGKSITLLELLATLEQNFPNFNQQVTFAPARPGDIKDSAADCTRYQMYKGIQDNDSLNHPADRPLGTTGISF